MSLWTVAYCPTVSNLAEKPFKWCYQVKFLSIFTTIAPTYLKFFPHLTLLLLYLRFFLLDLNETIAVFDIEILLAFSQLTRHFKSILASFLSFFDNHLQNDELCMQSNTYIV